MKHLAIYALYPNVAWIDDGTGAFDAQGNKVEIDESAVDAKALELELAEANAKQIAIDAKASALAKLAALGLTEDEVKSLLGVA
jgi:hypothetical protein